MCTYMELWYIIVNRKVGSLKTKGSWNPSRSPEFRKSSKRNDCVATYVTIKLAEVLHESGFLDGFQVDSLNGLVKRLLGSNR